MAEVKGLNRVLDALRARAVAAKKNEDVSCVVGYTAQYAVYVHEDLEANHPVGQAKFLEYPFRVMAPTISAIIMSELARGRSMAQALLVAGLRLQRESQRLCPIDTGNLRGSAFTRIE